ncbi:MAG TPA: ATP-binding protein [Blastocatellia bacterium]|nr:ATP-binding protein [Blastocatellia bacterium]
MTERQEQNGPRLSGTSRRQLTERGRRRLTRVIVLSIVVLLLLLSLVAQSGFNLKPFVAPDTTAETLLLYALTTLNFLAFITVLFVLMRNVLKLAQERRAGRLGSKFKARLVSYAIGLSLLPVLLLFFFAFGLLNRSIDRWFGEPARQIVDDAKAIEESYFKKEEAELASIARAVARALSLSSRADYDSPEFERLLKQEMSEYNLALAEIVAPPRRITVRNSDPAVLKEVEGRIEKIRDQASQTADHLTDRAGGESPNPIYVIAAARVSDVESDRRLLIVAREFPPELTRLAASIDEQHENFHSLLGKIKRIKAIYILLLAAVALLLIFAASWLALHVARGITVPIQALAEATDRVAHDDFAQPVDVIAEDELAVLVNSFNQMSAQLAENRERLVAAAEDLHRTNEALDNRRRYIETVLESLSTGVISTDDTTGIATINRAALYMLGLKEKPPIGTLISEVIGGEQGAALASLCRRARRTGTTQAEIEFRRADGSYLHTATTAIALRNGEGTVDGWVVVIEDLTDLIQAERAAAWSEVARRMAHEIKNPLTPIQLSAERIMRNYMRAAGGPTEPRFEEIVTEGTSTIVREVATLQRMVEEFSRFARLPEARPVDVSLNEVVRDAVGLYAERLNGIRIDCLLAEDLPVMRLDPEQIKRVLVNLIDNAIESLTSDGQRNGNGSDARSNGSAAKSIRIETAYLKASDAVRLVVSDTGHGIRPADRDKLFLPKFSTRSRGTGLGLAIVSHIIADHKGRIWVEDNQPRGARFIIELPAGRGE